MTSKAQTIASMISVVAEGRCALMATYQIFQFIIAYALVQVRRAGGVQAGFGRGSGGVRAGVAIDDD